jgi:NAD-specific glutamate dehydrogenase
MTRDPQAPVDLLWNGGIGTYVKARDESNADVGDRANDAIRVNGGELRARRGRGRQPRADPARPHRVRR